MTASSFKLGTRSLLFISTLPFKLVQTLPCSSPIIRCLNFSKSDSDNGLVKRSAIWSLVDTGCIVTFPCFKSSLKCQYLVFMYFVLGPIFGNVAIVKAPELSSNTLHLICLLLVHEFPPSSSLLLLRYTVLHSVLCIWLL